MQVFTMGARSGGESTVLGLWHCEQAVWEQRMAGVVRFQADLPVDAAAARLKTGAAQLSRTQDQLNELARAVDGLTLGLDGGAAHLDFGAGDSGRGWHDACAELASVATRAARWCVPHAFVDTRIGGELIGRSLLSLDGDVRTVWPARSGLQTVRAHQGTVALAVRSRAALLATAALAARVGTQIAVVMAMPIAGLLVLPRAWRLIQQLREALGELPSRRT